MEKPPKEVQTSCHLHTTDTCCSGKERSQYPISRKLMRSMEGPDVV